MKKIRLISSLMAIMFITLLACKKDEETQEELVVDIATATLLEGETQNISILSGNGGYILQSSSEETATAKLSDNQVVITAKKAGKANISITDAAGKTAKVAVSVMANIALDKTSVILKKGEKAEVLITAGQGNYSVNAEDPSTIKASLSGNKIEITALDYGETSVIVIDTETKKKEIIKVSVSDLVLDLPEIFLEANAQTEIVVTGSKNFSVTSENEQVVEVSVSENKIIFKAKTTGQTNVIVTDNSTKNTITIPVSISELTISENNLTMEQGSSKQVTITGSGIYDIINATQQITSSLDETQLTITAKEVGKSAITIVDRKTKATKVILITITKLDVSETEILMEKNSRKIITIAGSGSYEASANNQNVAVVVNKNELHITAKENGNAVITITDQNTKATKNITVKVNTFAVSETKIFLETNTQKQITISGSGSYVVSADNKKVTHSLDKNTLTIIAKEEGKTIVTIADQNTQATQKVEVNVSKLSLSEAKIHLEINAQKAVTITGSGSYEISADNQNVVSNLENNKLNITAKTSGNSVITITDKNTKATQKLEITITEIKISKTESELFVRDTDEVTISGSGDYEISVNDNTLVSYTLSANKLQISATKSGVAIISIKDKNTNKTVSVKVTVKDYPVLKASKNTTEIFIGRTEEITVEGGSGIYTLSTDNQAVKAVLENGKLTLEALQNGVTNVKISDAKAQKEIIVKVTSKPNPIADLAIDTQSVTLRGNKFVGGLSGDYGETKIFNITAGSGEYEVTSALETTAIAEKINDTQYKIIAKTFNDNQTTITVKDKKTNQTKAISVKVNKRFEVDSEYRSLTVNENESTKAKYIGLKPNANYSFSNAEIAEVTSIDNTISDGYAKYIHIKGKKAGTTVLTISEGDDVYKINIEVKAVAQLVIVTPLTNNTLIVKGDDNDDEDGALRVKGSGDFTITYSNNNIVGWIDTEKDECGAGCHLITFEKLDDGITDVTIKDNVTNKTITFKIKGEPL